MNHQVSQIAGTQNVWNDVFALETVQEDSHPQYWLNQCPCLVTVRQSWDQGDEAHYRCDQSSGPMRSSVLAIEHDVKRRSKDRSYDEPITNIANSPIFCLIGIRNL
jgi:hypothetical protein